MTHILAGLFLISQTALAERFAFDDTSGSIEFDMVASLHDVHGKANSFTGEVVLTDNLDADVQGKVVIQAGSLTTFIGVRDNRMFEYCLETDRFSTIEFKVSAIRGDTANLSKRKGSGEATLHGQMTIRSTSRDLSVPVTYSWEGDKLNVKGSHKIKWPDYGVPDPSIVISTLYPDLEFKFDVNLVARP